METLNHFFLGFLLFFCCSYFFFLSILYIFNVRMFNIFFMYFHVENWKIFRIWNSINDSLFFLVLIFIFPSFATFEKPFITHSIFGYCKSFERINSERKECKTSKNTKIYQNKHRLNHLWFSISIKFHCSFDIFCLLFLFFCLAFFVLFCSRYYFCLVSFTSHFITLFEFYVFFFVCFCQLFGFFFFSIKADLGINIRRLLHDNRHTRFEWTKGKFSEFSFYGISHDLRAVCFRL